MKRVLQGLLVILLLAFPFGLQAEKTKQAIRALEKGDYEKVEEILTKSMKKDSLNPATEYVWAVLYSIKDYHRYHLDTAHMFIVNACQHFELQNEDHLDELDDADIYEFDLKNQKLAIDSMAFVRAKSIHSIEGYDHFIDLYVDAAEFDEAVTARNQLAFAAVESKHTWQAYADFMAQYPDAVQVEKAQIQYDKLIYEERTSSGKIEDLENFLVDEPNTPYRHSIEKKIFENYVGELDSERLKAFITKYKNPVFCLRTLNMLYHLEGYDFSDVSSWYEVPESYMDSVNQLAALNTEPLMVQLRDSAFFFLDMDGRTFLQESFDGVSQKYKCGNILDDLLEVEVDGIKQLINRKGERIFEGYTSTVASIGSGLLAVDDNDGVGLIHKSGFRLLPSDFEKIELLENSLLVFWQQGKAGVMTITGTIYVQPTYDDIKLLGTFWVFEKDAQFGVTNRSQIISTKDSDFFADLRYEEVELINDQYIIGFTEESEELIGGNLEILSPELTRRINTRHETWVLEMDDGYTTFDPDLGKLSSNVYQNVLQNTEWLGLTRNGKWFVYNKNIYDEPIIGIDSLKLLGEDIAIVFRGTDGLAIFPNKKVVEVVEDQFLKSIGPKIKTDVHYLVVKEQGENILYKDGDELFRLDCDELGYISDSAFYIKKNGKYGAVGLNGRLIMRIRYDAISEAENEVAAVLYNGRFGGFNFRERVLLRMEYEQKLIPYNEDLFVIKDDGKFGLLDRLNDIRVEPGYDRIAYWSDSTFLGQNEGLWSIVNMADNSSILSGVLYYEYITDTPEEKVLLVRKEEGYGVYHSQKGMIIPTVFHDVMNLGDDEKQLYFTETAVSEADIYVTVYYNENGEKLFSEAYRGEVYENLVCED